MTCILKGGLRFYSLNSVDLATGRCAIEPVTEGKEGSMAAFWATWHRLGIPRYQQVDNEMTFYGSPTHPRGMGKLIRLCLHYGVEPIFIPLKEPWRIFRPASRQMRPAVWRDVQGDGGLKMDWTKPLDRS
jgi:putative transposase